MGTNNDEPTLTETEEKILEHLRDGYSREMIADKMGKAINTVHAHLRNAYLKLNAHNVGGALKRFGERINRRSDDSNK